MEQSNQEQNKKGKWYLSLPILLVTLFFCMPISLVLTIIRFTSIKRQDKKYRVGTIIAGGLQILTIIVFIFALSYQEPWVKDYNAALKAGDYQTAEAVLDKRGAVRWDSNLLKKYIELSEKSGDYGIAVGAVHEYYDSLDDKTKFDSTVLQMVKQLKNLDAEQEKICQEIISGIDDAKKLKEDQVQASKEEEEASKASVEGSKADEKAQLESLKVAEEESSRAEEEQQESIKAAEKSSNEKRENEEQESKKVKADETSTVSSTEGAIEIESSSEQETETVDISSSESKQSMDGSEYYTIYNCIYPKAFSSKRKLLLKRIQELNGKKSDEYDAKLKKVKDGEYKQTLDGSTLWYFGELKDGKPDGIGIIVQTIEQYVIDWEKDHAYQTVNGYSSSSISPDLPFSMSGKRIPIYAGEFKNGKFDGYGMELNYYGIQKEGEYKSGELNGDGIKYHDINQESKNTFEKNSEIWFSYCEQCPQGGVVITDYPVLIPAVRAEGTYKKGSFTGKKQKLYYKNYGKLKDSKTLAYGMYIEGSNYAPVCYEGETEDGEASGTGVFYYLNGTPEYKGELKKGKYNGKGILYNEDGSVKYDGKFKNGDIS